MTEPTRASRRRRLLVALLIAAPAFAGVCALAVALANRHVIARAGGSLYESAERVPSAYVAIVLGARVYSNGEPSPALEDRLASALELYRAGRVRRVLVSGDHGRSQYDETTVMARWLIARGVPSGDVFTDHAGFRTLDTMERAAKVFGVTEAIVCTQRFHLARSVFLAQRAGIRAVGVASDRHVYVRAARDRKREIVARAWAVLDTYVLHTRPRYLGEPIPIDGDAALSRDPRVPL